MKPVYKFVLKNEVMRKIDFLNGIEFYSEYLKIEYGVATIKKGYAHNGCSPKVKICGKIFGTWDGRKNELEDPSRWHDIFHKYSKELAKLGIERIDVDRLFLRDMIEVEFKEARLYYNAVRAFGGIGWKRGGI